MQCRAERLADIQLLTDIIGGRYLGLPVVDILNLISLGLGAVGSRRILLAVNIIRSTGMRAVIGGAAMRPFAVSTAATCFSLRKHRRPVLISRRELNACRSVGPQQHDVLLA